MTMWLNAPTLQRQVLHTEADIGVGQNKCDLSQAVIVWPSTAM